jgi:hypothetical protein
MATGRIPTTANSPLTVKGDLFGYSTTQARVPVGNDGETLVADSSTSTGLSYQGNYAAGKNKIINGDFRINQRAFTSTTTTGTYGFDRFRLSATGGTVTYSAQTFTAGAAPVAGYEAINFARIVNASQSAAGDYSVLFQRIEDVRTFAGQTITVSFWAKAGSGTPKIGVSLLQNFGSGGSSIVYTASTAPTITTSWARYSFTLNIPSISGKTIGTSSFLELAITTSAGATIEALGYPAVGVQNATFDIWGVQVEAGSVATAFQTATGTIQGELAACQRYYYRTNAGSAYGHFGVLMGYNNTSPRALINIPVPMRTAPSSLTVGGTLISFNNIDLRTLSSFTIAESSTNAIAINATSSATISSGVFNWIQANNDATTFIAFSAEL